MNLLKTIWSGIKRGWMKFAHILGRINTTILLSILYFVVVGIYSIIMRISGLIAFPFKKKPATYWKTFKETSDPDAYKHPF